MRKILISLATLVAMSCGLDNAQAQILVKDRIYRDGGQYVLDALGCTGENRQNDYFYRFRENVAENLKPGKISAANELTCVIAERNYDGTYLSLYRTPLGGDLDVYNLFIATLYNKKKKVITEVDLTLWGGFIGSEVQDVRYYDGYIYYNLPYITFSSGVNGECSKLYCIDPKNDNIVWETPYLVSNGIFIVDENYVACGYGFTDEDDFVYLVDRFSGRILSKVPVQSAPVYFEFDEEGSLIVMDYNDNVYSFSLEQEGLRVTGAGVRLRVQPSLEAEVYSENDNGRPTYAMKGDILRYLGEEGDFYSVIYNGAPVYIYKQYGEIVHNGD